MKLFLTFFILLLLQGCSTLSVQPQQAMLAGDTPSQWQLKGRIGVVSHNKVQNFGFNIKFKEQVFNLTLTGTLGLGQINIVSNNDGLYIDGHQSSQDLKTTNDQRIWLAFPSQKPG
jgi:Outer membrane lipoprotein LolB.